MKIFERFFPKEAEQTVKTTSQYPTEVLQIHHAFETAGESLLAEAQAILSECEGKSVDKGIRLNRLGFIQTKEAINATPYLNKGQTAKSVFDLVHHYQSRYPNNKFITEKQVKQICDKWNLVCAPIDRFKGFVPEKNLKQIEGFRLNWNDKAPSLIKISNAWNTETIAPDFLFRFFGGIAIHRMLNLKLIPSNHPRMNWHGTKLFGVKNEDGGMSYVTQYKQYDFDKQLICAPKKDMDLKGLAKIGSVFTSFKSVVNIPDPVVLQPVNGGYLIVTAWGDEASDENVVNEKMN